MRLSFWRTIKTELILHSRCWWADLSKLAWTQTGIGKGVSICVACRSGNYCKQAKCFANSLRSANTIARQKVGTKPICQSKICQTHCLIDYIDSLGRDAWKLPTSGKNWGKNLAREAGWPAQEALPSWAADRAFAYSVLATFLESFSKGVNQKWQCNKELQ